MSTSKDVWNDLSLLPRPTLEVLLKPPLMDGRSSANLLFYIESHRGQNSHLDLGATSVRRNNLLSQNPPKNLKSLVACAVFEEAESRKRAGNPVASLDHKIPLGERLGPFKLLPSSIGNMISSSATNDTQVPLEIQVANSLENSQLSFASKPDAAVNPSQVQLENQRTNFLEQSQLSLAENTDEHKAVQKVALQQVSNPIKEILMSQCHISSENPDPSRLTVARSAPAENVDSSIKCEGKKQFKVQQYQLKFGSEEKSPHVLLQEEEQKAVMENCKSENSSEADITAQGQRKKARNS